MSYTTSSDNVFIRFQKGGKNKPHVWFIHGFGASSDSFQDAFQFGCLHKYTMFAPDLPGFGLSPAPRRPHDVEKFTGLLKRLIKKYSPKNRVILVAHSLGGPIATKLAVSLQQKIAGYVSVEGNMTSEDCFFSGKTAKAKQPAKWKMAFEDDLYKEGLGHHDIRRYWASFRLANPLSLNTWARSGVRETGDMLGGTGFLKVKCPKIYMYGDKSISKKTRAFIETNNVDFVQFKNCGHFVMDDATELFYKTMSKFISTLA